jgi:hypothetical protein
MCGPLNVYQRVMPISDPWLMKFILVNLEWVRHIFRSSKFNE